MGSVSKKTGRVIDVLFRYTMAAVVLAVALALAAIVYWKTH